MEITASNAIFLGEETGGKGRQFKARFLVPGLVKYDYGVCLLTKENADKFIQGFTGCPVVINHQDVTDENAKDVRVGVIYSVWFDEKDGYFWCKGVIWDKEAIKLINEGYSVSCQYVITEYSDNTEGKLHNGNPYDKVIENGRPEHLAIVNNPRYEGAIIAVNAINRSGQDIEKSVIKDDKTIRREDDKFDTGIISNPTSEDPETKTNNGKALNVLTSERPNVSKNDIPALIADTIADTLAEGIADRLMAINEDKWITIHPHGKESDDYRRLKIKDGETVEDAMHRQGYYDKRKAKDEKDNKLPKKDEGKEYELDIKKHLEEMRKTRKDFKELTADFLNDIKTNDKTEYKKVMELIKKYFVTVKFLEKRGLLDKKEEIDRIPDYLNSDLKYTPEGEKLREFASKHGKTYGNLIKSIYELQKRKTASNSFIDELFDTLYKEFADRLGE